MFYDLRFVLNGGWGGGQKLDTQDLKNINPRLYLPWHPCPEHGHLERHISRRRV